MDFKMAGNENDLTQPKFELGNTGIIQDVFQGDKTTKQNKNKKLFSTGGGLGKISWFWFF